jgi:D-alanyl-D-alanine carboxypeptidase
MPGHTARASNNPGALNAESTWIQHFPGYLYRVETTPHNRTAVFEAPEYGVAAWWTLLKHYHEVLGADFSLKRIIYHYCGQGREVQAAAYLHFVVGRTKLNEAFIVNLNDDGTLLPIGRAFFRYEAGEESPLSDAQIKFGFDFARKRALAPAATSTNAAHSVEEIPF